MEQRLQRQVIPVSEIPILIRERKGGKVIGTVYKDASLDYTFKQPVSSKQETKRSRSGLPREKRIGY